MTWPKDANRIVVMFATQASATHASPTTNADHGPNQDEDVDVDLYVIDSSNRNILQHGTDTITSDAITLNYIGLDRTDYASRLSAPVFGLTTSHSHIGCAGYSKSSIHLYVASGKTVNGILSEIATSTSQGMCGTACEYTRRRRDLRFSGPAGQRYPDLYIGEKSKVGKDNPKGPKGACNTTNSQNEYKLHFDGVQYPISEPLEY